MHEWYCQGKYKLTQSGKYSITRSYQELLGHSPHMKIADLIWTAVALPKHRFMVVGSARSTTHSREEIEIAYSS